MSDFAIALLISLCLSVWLYSKFAKRSGGNLKTAVIGASVCGAILFIFLFIALHELVKSK